MSLLPAAKLISMIDASEIECPEVLSMDQILRMLGVLVFIALAIAFFSLTTSFAGTP